MYKVFLTVLYFSFFTYSEVIHVYGSRGTDIQRAINRAAHGDTVLIPQGDFSISRSVVISKEVHIMGSGKEKSRIYRSNDVKNSFWLFRVDGFMGRPVRISGLAFSGELSDPTLGILLENGVSDFRIDNCRFEGLSRRAIKVRDGGTGVIDNNTFIDNWPTAIVVYGKGDEQWEKGFSLGTGDAVFIEDNYFQQGDIPDKSMAHHIASNNGSKYVFRYNVIKDKRMASHAIDAHGNKFYWPRGSRSYEIYGNRIYAVHRWAGINIRGGDGVIFGNRFFGSFVSPIHLMHECREGDGDCVYPCVDQIRNLHIWDNLYNGKEVDVYVRHKRLIREDRDYMMYRHPEYEPFTYPHPLTVNEE